MLPSFEFTVTKLSRVTGDIIITTSLIVQSPTKVVQCFFLLKIGIILVKIKVTSGAQMVTGGNHFHEGRRGYVTLCIDLFYIKMAFTA